MDKEERDLMKSLEGDERRSVKDFKKQKDKAIEEGIPYQTLISSIIHK